MKVLIFDFETMDDKPATTIFTEIGAKLYDVIDDRLVACPGDNNELSALAYEPDFPPLTEFIQALTGLTDEKLKAEGKPRVELLARFACLLVQADIVMAHKSIFDTTIVIETAKKFELPSLVEVMRKKENICTLTNVKWPAHFTCHKLGHMSWELGLDVKAADLHRALNDVDLLSRMINLRPFSEILAYARTPWVYMKADILKPWGNTEVIGKAQNEFAKKVGFSYQNIKGLDYPTWEKTWVTRFKAGTNKENELREQIAHSDHPFRISVIEGIS